VTILMILVVRSMYKDFVLLLQEDRMLITSELKKKVCLNNVKESSYTSSFLMCITVTQDTVKLCSSVVIINILISCITCFSVKPTSVWLCIQIVLMIGLT